MDEVSSRKTMGRWAGVVYLVIIVFSAGGYMATTGLLQGDLPIVLARLASRHASFVAAFAAMVIGFAAWVPLALLLYRLTSFSGRLLGLLMLIFTLAGTAMNLDAMSYLLPLVGGSSSAMDPATLGPLVQSYNRITLLAQVFAGLWLFPYGLLVVRSRIAPRFLGWCVFVGGFSYLSVFATAFAPSLNQMMAYRVVSTALALPAMAGELGMCVWLLLKGASNPIRESARIAQTA